MAQILVEKPDQTRLQSNKSVYNKYSHEPQHRWPLNDQSGECRREQRFERAWSISSYK